MTKPTRRALCIVMIVLLVLSIALLLCRADHDCIGEGCPICALLLHKRSSLALACLPVLSCCLLSLALGCFRALCLCVKSTLPVAQGVRLNR